MPTAIQTASFIFPTSAIELPKHKNRKESASCSFQINFWIPEVYPFDSLIVFCRWAARHQTVGYKAIFSTVREQQSKWSKEEKVRPPNISLDVTRNSPNFPASTMFLLPSHVILFFPQQIRKRRKNVLSSSHESLLIVWRPEAAPILSHSSTPILININRFAFDGSVQRLRPRNLCKRARGTSHNPHVVWLVSSESLEYFCLFVDV